MLNLSKKIDIKLSKKARDNVMFMFNQFGGYLSLEETIDCMVEGYGKC